MVRKVGKEFDLTCIIEQMQRKMGCFSSIRGKGPLLFWENGEGYCERIVLLIHG